MTQYNKTDATSSPALKAWRLAVLCLVAMPLLAPAEPAGQRITPNFKDAEIGQIIEAVSLATGRNFIIDPRVHAQVTMLSNTPMTPEQFYQAFLSILSVHGFAAVPSGDVVKIIPDANMRQYPATDLPNRVSSSSDEVVTQVMAVKNVNANQLVPVLRPLMPQNANLSAVNGSNILILTDRANNVARLMRIIERIDTVGNSEFDVITLQSATAADTARVLNSLITQNGDLGSGVKIVADDRSNSIIISGDPTARLRVRALITHLDTPVDTGSETQVRYLHYTDATDLAKTLKEQMSSTNSATKTAYGPTGTVIPQQTPGAPPNVATAGANTPAGASTLSLASGQATIWADKPTNSLVITAGQRTMRALNAVIDKLDIRRPQVLVQAIIAEVTVDKTKDLGVNWALDGSATSAGVGGFISPVGGTSILDLYNAYVAGKTGSTTSTGTATSTTLPTGTTIGIGRLKATGLNFAAILRALQGDSRTNILATPEITTRDNTEAKMEVAQEVPFLTGQYSTTNGTGSAFQTIQRQEVGTILTVTPTINEGDAVMLKLQVESSSLASSSAGAVDLITNKRVINTNVLVKDGTTLVLGGLIQDQTTNSTQSVPLLGRIPIIGELFRTRDTQKTKTNFLIFLQPRILRDDAAAATETDAKYNYIRDQQRISTIDPMKVPAARMAQPDILPVMKNGRVDGVLSPDAPTPAPAAAPAPQPATTPATPDAGGKSP